MSKALDSSASTSMHEEEEKDLSLISPYYTYFTAFKEIIVPSKTSAPLIFPFLCFLFSTNRAREETKGSHA